MRWHLFAWFITVVGGWSGMANAAPILFVDFGVSDNPTAGNSTNDVQSGYFDASVTRSGGDATNGDQGNTAGSWLIGAFTVSITDSPAPADLEWRDRITGITAGSGAPISDLLEDFVFVRANESMVVTISGLNIGTEYQLITWHHDQNNGTAGTAAWNVNGGTSQNATTSSGNNSPTSLTFDFTATSTTATLTGTVGATGLQPLNGFTLEVIPEPGSLGLCVAGGLLLMARRRRSCSTPRGVRKPLVPVL